MPSSSAMVLTDHDVIAPEDLPAVIARGAAEDGPAANAEPSLREMQRRYVLSVMDRAGGNRAQAARILQISERTLYRLLTKYARRSESAGGTDGGPAS